MEILLFLLFPVVMWVMLIRPQQRRLREQQALVASLGEGDDVVTAGGVMGTIVALDDDVATLEVAPGLSIRVLRRALTGRVGPDEDEDAEAALPEGGEGEDGENI
jgi:preprotein translocase subunit YajC